jgi:cellulose synthase operon protein C
VQQGRCEEALAAAEEGVRREPQWTFSHSMLGSVHEQRGEPARAQECYREAIRLSVDNGYAVEHLMATCHTLAGRREALRFIEEELIRQVVFGDGLLAFRDVARGILDPNELLASLQAALDARPDLWHAWSAMILQLIDLQRAEDAVALAREATERFPLLPRIWLDLAAAERARLDPGEEAALQQALRINPDWGIAARQLAGCYERKGEFEKACALLEGLCARAPLDAFNHGALAEVLWRLGRRDEALEKLQLALRLQPGFEWGWQLLLRWAGELGRPGLALEMARDLTVRRAGEASVWLVLARCLEEAGEEQELFTALDQAIALQPRSTDASDLKAALLARHRRFAEALAACQPAVFGEHPPPELRGRAAWVEAERGNLPRAISLMQAVLAENPAYFWGWQQLTDWLWRDNQHDEAVRAAEKMTTLAPFEPSPLGYLADLKVRKDDREGAKRDLARALKVDPAYAYAGFQLFDLHLEDRELPAAAEILGHLQRHIGGDLVQARAAQLAIRQRGCDQAQELFRDLCASRKEENIWPVSVVADELAGASLGQTAERILREALDQPDPPGRVAQVWVKRRLDLHQWWCQGKLRQLKDRGEAGRLAVLQYLDSLGDAILACQSKQDVTGRLALQFHFWRLLRTHRCWLAKDDLGWGKVGYVLANLGWHRRLVKWLGDWRERPGAESWMLHNLVLALHALGRDAEADAVVRQALARPAFGDLRARLLLWAAVEDALSGRLEAAKALLEGLRAEHTPADEQSLFRLVNLVLAFEQAAIQPPEFARAERAMMKEFLDQHPNNRTMQRVFLRALRRISERTGSRWPLWWGCGKRYQPALIAAAIGMAFLALKVLALSGGS